MKTVYNPSGSTGQAAKPVIIFDLDGTISNDSGRERWLREARRCLREHQIGQMPPGENVSWREQAEIAFHNYHSRCKHDAVNKEVLLILKAFLDSPDHEVWILTARSEQYSRETIEWLYQHLNNRRFPHRVIMRELEERGGSPAIKKKFILENIPSAFLLDSVIFDNDERVIAAMQETIQTMLYKQTDGI